MIARDGAYVSPWQDVPVYQTQRKASAKQVYDVVIVGGGITGISTGLMLQKAGKTCIVLEANNLCFGTTGGTTAHINTLLDTSYSRIIKDFGLENAKLVLQATRESLDTIRQNIKDYNIDCGFEEASAYLFSQDEKQTEELNKIYQACVEVGLESTYSNEIPVPVSFTKAIVAGNQAKFHPVNYVHALAQSGEEVHC